MHTHDHALIERLREAGFKATPGRLRLLKALAEDGKPRTVAELGDKLKGKLNRVTLYRALEALAGTGIIKRVDLHHAHAHYELERTHHHHLVCTSCGLVEDVAVCPEPLARQALRGSRTFASITNHDLAFFGLCRKCA